MSIWVYSHKPGSFALDRPIHRGRSISLLLESSLPSVIRTYIKVCIAIHSYTCMQNVHTCKIRILERTHINMQPSCWCNRLVSQETCQEPLIRKRPFCKYMVEKTHKSNGSLADVLRHTLSTPALCSLECFCRALAQVAFLEGPWDVSDVLGKGKEKMNSEHRQNLQNLEVYLKV